MKRSLLGFVSLVLMLAVSGCDMGPSLIMKPLLDPIDRSAISPRLSSLKFTKIMVIPAAGTDKVGYEKDIFLLEKEFITGGLTPYAATAIGGASLAANGQSGAEAVLEVLSVGWDVEVRTDDKEAKAAPLDSALIPETRFFVFDRTKGKECFREVSEKEYQDCHDVKQAFRSPRYSFKARLIRVSDGQVMALLDIQSPANSNLNREFNLNGFNDEGNYVYTKGDWLKAAQQKTLERVFQLVAKKVSGRK